MSTLTINGQVYTKATAEQIKTFTDKLFVPSDGMKEGDKITFTDNLEMFNTSGKMPSGEVQNWNVFPCEILRNGEKLQGVISTSTLLNSGFVTANPENGTQKNVPFNTFAVDAITGKKKEEIVNILINLLKGKTFTIRRATFHQPTDWVDKKVLKNGELVVDLKENGKPRKTPFVKEIGGIEKIPTSPKTVSQLV